MPRPPSTPSFSGTQERLSALIQDSRDRQSRNLAALRRNIEAAESPVEGRIPRPEEPARSQRTEPELAQSRERQRIALVRATLPPPGKHSDWGSGIIDRVKSTYTRFGRK